MAILYIEKEKTRTLKVKGNDKLWMHLIRNYSTENFTQKAKTADFPKIPILPKRGFQ